MHIQNDLCLICGEGFLTEESRTEEIVYKNTNMKVVFVDSVCNECCCEQMTSEQSRANKRSVIASKKEVDGLLAGKEVLAIRHLFGISQKQAAKIFGGGEVAFSKYESDDVMQSEAMDKLLRAARDVDGFFAYLQRTYSDASYMPSETHEVTGARTLHSLFALQDSHSALQDRMNTLLQDCDARIGRSTTVYRLATSGNQAMHAWHRIFHDDTEPFVFNNLDSPLFSVDYELHKIDTGLLKYKKERVPS